METGSGSVGFIIGLLFLAGALGGLANAVIAGELKLPSHDPEAGVWRPGWIGNVLIGGIAGLVLWGLYGPMANTPVIGEAASVLPVLKVSELFGALVTGVGGGRILTDLVAKQRSEIEKLDSRETVSNLANTLRELAS